MISLTEKEKIWNRICEIESYIRDASNKMNEAYQVYMEHLNKRAELYEEMEILEAKIEAENGEE